MLYHSTRSKDTKVNFETVLLNGLAPDGGLYIPENWPQISLEDIKGKSYQEMATIILYPFLEEEMSFDDLTKLIKKAYSSFRHIDIAPLIEFDDQYALIELFHGPTFAFKDFALQLLGELFDYFLEKTNKHLTIIGATSGDTGSAAIQACKDKDHFDIFMFHPKDRVSDVQRKQMTTVTSKNVYNIALEGTFDDCQNMVKSLFADSEFNNDFHLSAVNSINWARIMAQIVYYFFAYTKLNSLQGKVNFCVPTGNFGNVYAGYAAKSMGLPIDKLIVASNENDILTRFFQQNDMSMRDVVKTHSPSMDIQISSNFERFLFDLLGKDSIELSQTMSHFKRTGRLDLDEKEWMKAKDIFEGLSVSNKETEDMIKSVFDHHKMILDPHTAVGVKAAYDYESSYKTIILATAHPAKFKPAVEQSMRQTFSSPDMLKELDTLQETYICLSNNKESVKSYIRKELL